jgi:hypothetical protein
MAPSQRSDSLPPDVDQLRARIAELEARLAQASAALEDPEYLAGRLVRLLADKPDLAATVRYVAQVLRDLSHTEG